MREMMMILMKMMQCYRGCLNVEQTGPVWSNRLLALNNLGKLHQCVCVMPAHVCAHLCIRRKTAVLSNNSFSQIHYFFLVLGYLCITYISINIIRRCTFEVVAPLYMFFSCMPHIPSSIHTPMFQILLRSFLHGISNLFSAQVFKQEHTPFLTNTHQVQSS